MIGGGASFDKGGMVTEKAIKANEWYVNLFRQDKITPPSAPTDSFRQIIDAFKAGRTAMVIHHLTTANEMVQTLGDDKVGAAPVPHGPDGKAWTIFGDESNAIFSTCKNKEAAFKWISFLSSAEGNMMFTKETAQLTMTKSGAANWDAASQTLRRCEPAVAAVLGRAAGFAQDGRLRARGVADEHAARSAGRDHACCRMMQAYEKHYHG